MERQMWADFKAKDWKVVESKIAQGFQSIHPDGPRDRAGEISLIEHLNLGEFTLSNFKTTVNGDNIVVTYTIAVQATIDQQRLPAKPTPRLSVWKKGTHGWQWIFHANLHPIPQARILGRVNHHSRAHRFYHLSSLHTALSQQPLASANSFRV